MGFDLADFPEAFEQPLRVSALSAWLSHVPLAAILVKLLRPGSFVELGTHAGDSYLAFCQAVRNLGTGTRCTAIDTWQGDQHTGAYGPEILGELRALHDPNFGSFSRLLQSTFDGAAGTFADASIDLLHIDGMHTYDAVRHDFETWLPKMSRRGVVLFHDTAERGPDFGIWKFWGEVSTGRVSANLPYGHGLGILGVGSELPAGFVEFVEALNTRRGVVKILEAMGARIHLLRNFGSTLRHLMQCRALAQEFQRRTGQPVGEAPRLETALADPEAFGAATVGEVRQMGADGLNVVGELMRLRTGPTTS